MTAAASLNAQLIELATPGIYCVEIADIGDSVNRSPLQHGSLIHEVAALVAHSHGDARIGVQRR